MPFFSRPCTDRSTIDNNNTTYNHNGHDSSSRSSSTFSRSFKTSLMLGLSLLTLASLPLTYAQQYDGEKFRGNNMTDVDGAEIAYFNINDSGDSSKNGTLVNYYSLDEKGDKLDPENIKRVVILIHGAARDPWSYIEYGLDGVDSANDSSISRNNVAIFAPFFANNDDAGDVYPWDNGPTTNALVWDDADWINGDDASYPNHLDGISTFDVLDQVVKYFDNTTLFPNVNQIIVGGHSGGSQMTQRYAAVGMDFDTNSPVTFYIANPDSWLWMEESRPLAIDGCTEYDEWRYGLGNYTIRYNADLVAEGRDTILKRYDDRKFAYQRGMQDYGDQSVSCATFPTGDNRGERFFNFINTWPPTCNDGAGTTCDTIDYLWDIGHDASGMLTSKEGITRLFIDNFDGDGSQATDFGYPRVQPNDDPYPDVKSAKQYAYSGISTVNNGSFVGCFSSNASADALTTMLYQTWNKNMTIGVCTAACKKKGYELAGLLNGRDCFCDDSVADTSYQTADGGCYVTCTGNDEQVCGSDTRMSVYNTTKPADPPSSTGTNGDGAGGGVSVGGNVTADNDTKSAATSLLVGSGGVAGLWFNIGLTGLATMVGMYFM